MRVSSTPVCEITIDGTPTRLVTPQRAIRLPAGTHSVLLTNARLKIRKSITVAIKARRVTRLIEDFMEP